MAVGRTELQVLPILRWNTGRLQTVGRVPLQRNGRNHKRTWSGTEKKMERQQESETSQDHKT